MTVPTVVAISSLASSGDDNRGYSLHYKIHVIKDSFNGSINNHNRYIEIHRSYILLIGL